MISVREARLPTVDTGGAPQAWLSRHHGLAGVASVGVASAIAGIGAVRAGARR